MKTDCFAEQVYNTLPPDNFRPDWAAVGQHHEGELAAGREPLAESGIEFDKEGFIYSEQPLFARRQPFLNLGLGLLTGFGRIGINPGQVKAGNAFREGENQEAAH